VAGENSSIPPVVANGVVYYVQPLASSLGAFDETTGRQLWSSGSLLKGGVFASPAVANGQLLAVDFAGRLHAFAP
jgi:outer membrane protein assembly factor BamB